MTDEKGSIIKLHITKNHIRCLNSAESFFIMRTVKYMTANTKKPLINVIVNNDTSLNET